MRISTVASALLGSFVVYGFVAACGSSSSDPDGISIRGMADAMVNVIEGGDSTPVAHAGGDSGGGGTTTVTDPTGYVSGTRLKAKRLLTPDGANQFSTWFDTSRQEDCGFLPMSDGNQHCIPIATSTDAPFFTDSGCTTPAALTAPTCATSPKYLYWLAYANGTCGAYHYVIATAGTPVTLTATSTFYTGTPSACSAAMIPAYAGYTLTPAAAEIDLSMFVQGSIATDP